LLKDKSGIGSGSETFQTEIGYRVLDGLAPEKAF
jgi:hypothetical protein